jgi:hypothetical protein
MVPNPFPHRFTGKTGRSNSKLHLAKSRNPPVGALAYRALCGALITTNGQGEEGVNCPRCLTAIRRELRR